MTTQQIISAKILAVLAVNGNDIKAAVDSVLGAGTYMNLAEQVWEAAQTA